MHIITRDHIVYSFSRDHRPVSEVDSGDKIRFETYDARTGTILSENDLLDHPHPRGLNPATGPLFVSVVPSRGIPSALRFRISNSLRKVLSGLKQVRATWGISQNGM